MIGFWTDERITLLRAMVDEGKSGSQIAAVLDCTRNAVIGMVARANGDYGTLKGVRKGGAPKPVDPSVPFARFWTDERVATLTRMVGENATAAQIGAVLGCSRQAVSSKIKRGKGQYGHLERPSNPRMLKSARVDGVLATPRGWIHHPPKLVPVRAPWVPACEPITFIQAADQRRCLWFAGEAMGPNTSTMLVCGDAVVDRSAMPGKRARTHCKRHLLMSTCEGTAAERAASLMRIRRAA